MDAIQLVGGGQMILAPGQDKTPFTASLSIDSANGSRLDLSDNRMIVDRGSAVGTFSGGAYNGLTGLIASAYDFNAWDGPGITTSMPQASNGLTTIAIATVEQMTGLTPSQSEVMAGHFVYGDSVVLMYTYAGDANLDGVIDGGDYGTIDNSIQIPGAFGYVNGDFNYDGVIDGGDYGIIDNNIYAQGAAL
jgi:hypothetical protein